MEALLVHGDRLRRELLRGVVRIAGPVVASREERVAVVGAFATATALLGALLVPLWLVLLGPLVWGVPHVVADLRYLFVRERPGRKIAIAVLVAGASLARALGRGLPAVLVAGAIAALIAQGPVRRRLILAAIALGAAAVALAVGPIGDLLFLHAHNVVAVALFWAWRRRRTRAHLVAIAAFAAGGALLLSGLPERTEPIAVALAAPLADLPTGEIVRSITGGAGASWTLRLLAFYAFAQSIHYVVWLRLIPEEDRARPAAPPLRVAYRALVSDLGGRLLVVAAAVAVVVLGWALFDPVAARQGYLVAASFHGYLEVVAGAFLLAEGRRPGGRHG